MTAREPHPLRTHCKNEGRCFDFTMAPKEWHGKNGECLLRCDGDTRRSRPHPAPEPTAEDIKAVKIELAENAAMKELTDEAARKAREEMGAKLCAFLHHSYSENEKLAVTSKGKAREICKGRMFEDDQIIEALEELRVTGDIKIQSESLRQQDKGGQQG